MLTMILIHAAYLVPLAAALLIGTIFRREKQAFLLTAAAQVLSLACVAGLAFLWWREGFASMEIRPIETSWLEWKLEVDGIALTFLLTLGWIGTVSALYSRRYLHNEEGVIRFFALMNVFCGGMALLLLSDNLTTLFAGWEIIGTASFLLIGFYHRREAASRAALTAFSVYRVCDAALLSAGALIGHESLRTGTGAWLIPLLLVIGAMGKGGQFPFTFWVARAMEGPSSSSAFFYGAISTHAGIYILLRMMPYWDHQPFAHSLIMGVGMMTALTSSWIMRVQSNLKGRIAYAATTQVGIMMMELAAGFPRLAVLHFVGNACLRCYQLLATPAIAVNRIQSGRFDRVMQDLRPVSRMEASSYVLALRECAMPEFFRARPRAWRRKDATLLYWSAGAMLLLPMVAVWVGIGGEHSYWSLQLLSIAAAAGLVATFVRGSAQLAWNLCLISNLTVAVAAALMNQQRGEVDLWPLVHGATGILAWSLATGTHLYLKMRNLEQSPGEFAGGATRHPVVARLGLLAFLLLSGFPMLPIFLSEDRIMETMMAGGGLQASFFALAFIGTGIGAAASFCRVYHGAPGAPSAPGVARAADQKFDSPNSLYAV